MSVDAALLHACDVNYWHGDAVLFGASLRGEVIESHALHLCCCGFPAADFNRLRLKHADDLPASLARGEAWFGERGLPWRVELRSELEAECADALLARGYSRVRETPGMVLAPIRDGGGEVPGLEIRRVEADADLERFQRTAFEGFGLPGQLGPLFITPAMRALPGVELFLGLVDGDPVATSCLVVSPGVAGIYWVSTLEAQRGRGLGEALTWAAVRAGIEAGCPVASLQASEMGAPVYARMGFETPLRYALWDPPPRSD